MRNGRRFLKEVCIMMVVMLGIGFENDEWSLSSIASEIAGRVRGGGEENFEERERVRVMTVPEQRARAQTNLRPYRCCGEYFRQ